MWKKANMTSLLKKEDKSEEIHNQKELVEEE
jgi:hypothetical protein